MATIDLSHGENVRYRWIRKEACPTAIRHIAVEGPIGAGKTTLAECLQKELGGRLMLESFEENPFLRHFYRDPSQFALPAQLFFLLERYRQQNDLIQLELFDDLLISDYSFLKDPVFARITLNDQDFQMYSGIYSSIAPRVPQPDLIIYLNTSSDILLKRIADRGRPMEADISSEYLEALTRGYADTLAHATQRPVLIVNGNEIDFVKDPDSLGEIVELAGIRETVRS